MKRSFVATLLACTVLGGTGALAQELVTADRVGDPGAPNVLTFRTNPGQSPNNPSPEQNAAFKPIWQEFAEAHPDWQVQFEFFSTDIGGEHARLLEQARAGRAPDCVSVDSFQLALFVQNGVLQPVTSFFEQEEIDDLFPFIREGITGEDGEIYAWWWGTDLRIFYRDTTVMPDAPATWDELQAAASAAAEAGKEGVLFNGGRWEGTAFDWLAHFWSQGGELVDDTGKPIFGEGDNREYMLNALTFYDELVESGAAPSRVANIATYDDFNAAAIAGTAASFIGGHWQRSQIREGMSPEQFANWEVSEIPGPTPDQRATGTGGWTVAAFSDDPAKIEMCVALMREVFMGPANEVVGDLPTRQALFDSLPRFQDEYFTQLRDYLVNGKARPGVPIYPEISNQLQIMMGEVLAQTKEPDAALTDAWNAVNEAYSRM
ncbi:extracellular solute-binding protein [Devosia nitrariae]|uniref:Sugar ABC transporter substrate-binding protein n=1 Tax=Devosia nitrariae TaxID=2071872 RepID=A0ABQ5W5P6_9HYPH|nr:extracellular solute-binding protein [Devosia nitrariae]GLQ55109.1 sugar ABC transporter substrate-binding protein [Devosia nitrariae]